MKIPIILESFINPFPEGDGLEKAYNLGWDCQVNGANEENCHFSLFSTPEITKAWEAGKKDAKEANAL